MGVAGLNGHRLRWKSLARWPQGQGVGVLVTRRCAARQRPQVPSIGSDRRPLRGHAVAAHNVPVQVPGVLVLTEVRDDSTGTVLLQDAARLKSNDVEDCVQQWRVGLEQVEYVAARNDNNVSSVVRRARVLERDDLIIFVEHADCRPPGENRIAVEVAHGRGASRPP